MSTFNSFGQPIGAPLPTWNPPPFPPHQPLAGRFCRLEAFQLSHVPALYQAFAADQTGQMWTYLPYGPFASEAAYYAWAEQQQSAEDPQFYVVSPQQAVFAPLGIAAYLRIFPAVGSIEIGHLAFSPAIKRSPITSEALMLLIGKAFELGYRRVEWKCDALNAPSRAAAERLGFRYEGTFRQAMVVKGRNRDTAWFSIIDSEWPLLAFAYAAWLDPSNIGPAGQQRERLQTIISRVRDA